MCTLQRRSKIGWPLRRSAEIRCGACAWSGSLILFVLGVLLLVPGARLRADDSNVQPAGLLKCAAMHPSALLSGRPPPGLPASSGLMHRDVEVLTPVFGWIRLNRGRKSAGDLIAVVLDGAFDFRGLSGRRFFGFIFLAPIEALLIWLLVRVVFDQRRRLRLGLQQQEVATLIAELAANFINVPAAMIDEEMEKSAERLLEPFSLDHIRLFEFCAEPMGLRLLCSRTREGIPLPPPPIDLQRQSWTAAQIVQGTPILVSSLDRLPEEAKDLRDVLMASGVRSFAAFPIRCGGSTRAALTLSTVRNQGEWYPDVIQALQTVADIFGNTLERSFAEQAATENRDRLSGIIASAMDAILVIDMQNRIIVFNAAAEKIFGCPVAEALMQPLERFIPTRFRKRDHDDVADFGQSDRLNRRIGGFRAVRALRADGEEFPAEVSISQVETNEGKVFTAIVRDVAEREKVEEALRASEQQKASILDSLSSHVVVVDSTGTVVAENSPEIAFSERDHSLRFGIGANYFESCRRSIGDGMPELRAAYSAIQNVFDGKRDFEEFSFPVRATDDERWLSMSVTPLRGADRGIVISYQDITQRKRSEEAIRDLSGRVMHAQEQERSRIARELHDDINQRLAILCIELQQTSATLPQDSIEARQSLEDIWKKTHDLSTDVQRLSHQLHSAKLEHLGIVAALRDLCHEFEAQHKIRADFKYHHVPLSLNPDVSLSVFRAAQESLRNVAKHSGAKKVQVDLIGRADAMVLRVSDDGAGFDLSGSKATGLGLVSMSERMRLVGGTFSVWSKPSAGTQVEASVPLPRPAAV